ncbi:MAG: ATP-binding protein [bacterium]
MKNLSSRVHHPHFIIHFSIFLVCFFWIMDALLDSILFHEGTGTFFDFVLLNIPPHEFFLRLFFFIIFITGGVLISKLLRLQRESQGRYNSMFQHMSNAVAIYEAVNGGNDFIYKDLNRAAEKIEKINKTDLIGKSVLNIFPEVKNTGFFEVLQKVWKTGKPEHLPVSIYKNQKISRWKENYIYKLPTGEIVAIYEDITAYKKLEEAEKALKKVNTFNQTIINTIPFGMNIVDLEGNILFMTDRSKEICGVDAIGKKCWDFFKDYKKQCESCPLKKGVNIGQTKTVEIEDMFKGKIFQISYTGMYYQGKKAILSILQDITEQKKVEKKIREAVEMKSAFISVVSHELRTPLTAIKEGIGIVLEGIPGKLNGKQKNFLSIAKRNVDRLARLINEVLDFQKLESGHTEFNMMNHDINEVVEEVYKSMAPSVHHKTIDFLLSLTDNLPLIRFDKDKIIQVLTNLINNAVKFTERGRIAIETRREKNIIQVSVCDTGGGIKKEDIPQIFEKFKQIAMSKGRNSGGTGLGLAICKEIIERHKGKIWAESECGKGTTVHFVLPIKEQRK